MSGPCCWREHAGVLWASRRTADGWQSARARGARWMGEADARRSLGWMDGGWRMGMGLSGAKGRGEGLGERERERASGSWTSLWAPRCGCQAGRMRPARRPVSGWMMDAPECMHGGRACFERRMVSRFCPVAGSVSPPHRRLSSLFPFPSLAQFPLPIARSVSPPHRSS